MGGVVQIESSPEIEVYVSWRCFGGTYNVIQVNYETIGSQLVTTPNQAFFASKDSVIWYILVTNNSPNATLSNFTITPISIQDRMNEFSKNFLIATTYITTGEIVEVEIEGDNYQLFKYVGSSQTGLVQFLTMKGQLSGI